MCLVWEPTVNNTVPFGSELAAESQIQRIPFPKPQRRAGPPRPAGEGQGQALARYLARPAPNCTSPPHPAGHGVAVTETPSSSSPPPLPLDRGPLRLAGESSRGWAVVRRWPESSRPGREGRSAGRAGRRYLSPQLILQLCREAAGGKGRKCSVSPLPKGTLLLQAAIKGAFAAGRPAFW